MIETTVRDYLTHAVGLPVYLEVPENPTGEYLVMEKTGGTERDHLETAMIAIQSYGETLFRAAEINEAVKAAMRDMPGVTNVSRAELNSNYNFTDAETKRYRYQSVYDLTY